jgi:hypothetical protein
VSLLSGREEYHAMQSRGSGVITDVSVFFDLGILDKTKTDNAFNYCVINLFGGNCFFIIFVFINLI